MKTTAADADEDEEKEGENIGVWHFKALSLAKWPKSAMIWSEIKSSLVIFSKRRTAIDHFYPQKFIFFIFFFSKDIFFATQAVLLFSCKCWMAVNEDSSLHLQITSSHQKCVGVIAEDYTWRSVCTFLVGWPFDWSVAFLVIPCLFYSFLPAAHTSSSLPFSITQMY